LLVGKTSSGIGVVGTEVNAGGQLLVTADQDNPADFNRKTSDGIIALFRKDSTAVGSIGTVGSDLVITSSVSGHKGLRFGLNYIAPIDTSYSYTDATTDLGLSDVRFKDLYLSGGVVFGTTGGSVSSKTLDDYESGTFTPVLWYAGTMTYGVQSGFYTKVGNLVTVNMTLVCATLGTASGVILLAGLPFTISSGANFACTSPVYGGSFATARTSLVAVGDAGTTYLGVYYNSGNTPAYLTHADLGGTGTLFVTATYRTDS